MIILQAGILGGEVLVWGELSADLVKSARARTRADVPSGIREPVPVPLLRYAAGPRRLGETFRRLGLPVGRPARRVGWLPTIAGVALPSTPILTETPPPAGEPGLTAWLLPVRRLNGRDAVDFFCACEGKETLAPGVILGVTLAFLTTVFRWAGSLVAREQFLPGVERRGHRVCASWQPVLVGATAEQLARLARAMPPACRALGPLSDEVDRPPSTPAETILSSALGIFVEALVRGSFSPAAGPPAAPSTPPPPRRKPRLSFRAPPPAASLASTIDSVHDQWLEALTTADGVVAGGADDRTALADLVRRWRRPLDVLTSAPFRLCFRLEEPDVDDDEIGLYQSAEDPWLLRYLMQSVEDPSLLVPLDEVWAGRGSTQALFRRSGFEPREYLLTAFGQAALLCPPVAASLGESVPAGVELSPALAHDFLGGQAAALEQAGFPVLLPAWWTRKGTKQKLTARLDVRSPKSQGSGLTLDALVTVDWRVALGDETISRGELEALARLKAPLLKVRGQWVQLSPEEIAAALHFWKTKSGGPATVREVVRLAVGAATAPGGLDVTAVDATGWVKDFLGQLTTTSTYEELAPPAGFGGSLRPYQRRGYSWLAFLGRWGLGACLADDMGLGKTVQTLAMLLKEWQDTPPDRRRPALLICPMSVVGNWQKEAARFTPELPVLIHHGAKRRKGEAFAELVNDRGLVLSSYALLYRDLDLLKAASWSAVILDEAQNIKNPDSKQAVAARSLTAGRKLALTGTPVENHVGDLWSVMEFLNPGFLGTQAAFRRQFFIPIQARRDEEAAKRLRRLTGPFILRRLKTDPTNITDLPDKIETKVYCTLTREQGTLYAAVLDELKDGLASADGIARKGLILAALSKLKQVCNHPAQFLGDNSAVPDRSGKLTRLTEMLTEVFGAKEKVLIFSQFSEMGAILKRHLQETFGREVLFLHGGVPKAQRDRMVERFQTEPDGPRAFVLSLKAGGTGLNLTAATHVFHFDRWWNPAVENQATDRAFRIGQRRNVQVHKFVCLGTMEERVDDMIERKQSIAAKIVGTGEGWLTEMSDRQLHEVLRLTDEAIGG